MNPKSDILSGVKTCFRRLASFACLWLIFPLFLAAPMFGQTSQICMMCHANRSLAIQRSGRTISMFVDAKSLKESAHAALSCDICHRGLNPTAIPHAKDIKPVQCQTCHPVAGFDKSVHASVACKTCHGTHEIRRSKDLQSASHRTNVSNSCGLCHPAAKNQYQGSAHGTALARGASKSPSCVDCHGAHAIVRLAGEESPLFKTKEVKFCLKCHLDDPEILEKSGVDPGFIKSYETSVHGIALASGNLKSAGCSDCHGAHDAKKANAPTSRLNKFNIADTCARCHDEIAKAFNASIHGGALRMGKSDSPTCTDCHGEHQIFKADDPRSPVSAQNVSRQVCGGCHDSVRLNQKYGMLSGRFDTYMDSYHGLALKAGSMEAANCASCHGVHNVLPSSNPASTVHKDNIASTCGKCHPGADQNFAKGSVHVVFERESSGAILYWIRAIYIVLIVVIVGSMFLHNLLDFVQKSRRRFAVRRGRLVHEQSRSAQYLRMSLNERIQHAVMLTTFILLAVTGFILRYPDAWWVVPIRQLSERFFELRSLVHRIAGFLMIAVSLYHLFYILFTGRGKGFLQDMLPKFKDILDVWRNLLHLLGLSKKKALFDRFGYIEKAEYWALVWGVLLMGATGVILWFEIYFIGLFTKLGWDVVRTIHFYEACLATLAIVVWHFYFVLFSPDIYPMNTAWLTGKISEEEMAEEHPLELARLQSQLEPQNKPEPSA